jgi:ABC-type multidrug transport system ATPase subunit
MFRATGDRSGLFFFTFETTSTVLRTTKEFAMIEVDKLSKEYGDYVAVSDISFSAAQGEIVGFLGPNGAGKTTTIRMLSTYLPPSCGTARIAGFDIVKDSDSVRKAIGYLPENPPLYGEMRIDEYLTFVAQLKGVPSRHVKERVEQVMESCYVADVRKKLCRHLSRGYRQRVGIAQAIVHDPKVIILDEPTSGLDPKQITQIRELIRSLGKNHTVILSTHILAEVSMVCSKVVIIAGGRIALEKPLSELGGTENLERVFLESIGRDRELTNSVAA